MKQKSIAAQIVLNIAAWAIFFMLPFAFLFPSNSKISALDSHRFIWMLISSNIILITFYYLNRWWLIPRLLANKHTLIYIAAVIAYLLLYLGVMFFIFVDSPETKQWLLTMLQKNPDYKFKPRFFSAGPLTLFLLTFIISSSSKVISQWFYAEETRQEITKQQLQTELSLLKSQVNPHFLFNTLNSIYSLSVTNSEKTSDAVMKLSRIMRYTLEESKNDEVPLGDEIEFIRSYIDLQKIRLTDMVRIDFTTDGIADNVIIAPLLFIPFIENAFKYGISTHHPSHIIITIAIQHNELIFTCVNDQVPVSHKHESTGTGIVNTRRRLELLYPGKHTLSIESNTRQYNVLLRLNLNV